MNHYSWFHGAAWALAAVVIATTLVAWSTAVPVVVPETVTSSDSRSIRVAVTPVPDSSRLSLAATSLRDRDPFRFDRKPATVRFNPAGTIDQPNAASPPRPPRPALRLVGIIGSTPWTVVVEGVPGREGGVVLHAGEETGGIRLMVAGGDSAVISGFDTAWVLRVRAPWR